MFIGLKFHCNTMSTFIYIIKYITFLENSKIDAFACIIDMQPIVDHTCLCAYNDAVECYLGSL